MSLFYINMVLKRINQLCTPSYVYLVISSIVLILMAIQNVGNTHTYCAGNISCNSTSTTIIFILKIIYVIFWTWVLDLICGAGWNAISWILVLIPFILMFLFLGTFMLNSSGNVQVMYFSSPSG